MSYINHNPLNYVGQKKKIKQKIPNIFYCKFFI